MMKEFTVEADGRRVPAVVWQPQQESGSQGTVLIGHGGSQHKTHPGIVELAGRLVQHGFAAVCIDGPVQGARRTDGKAGLEVQSEFAKLWGGNSPRIDETVADWQATIRVLGSMAGLSTTNLAWYGVSMGTAYGLPLCAVEPRITTAMFGMWGIASSEGVPDAHGQRLIEAAAKVNAHVLFQLKWDDQFFSRQGQFHLFSAVASPDKWLKTYPGGHVAVSGEQLDDAIAFTATRLKRAAERGPTTS